MRVLIINNESRHLHELAGAVYELTGRLADIILWRDLHVGHAEAYDRILISGTPAYAVELYENMYAPQMQIIRECEMPLLGVCVGFELICRVYGAHLLRAQRGIHGVTTAEVHIPDRLIPDGTVHMRIYEHHRYICEQVSSPLVPLITSPTGVKMVRHLTRAVYGCQFHPEVAWPQNDGHFILERFLS